MASFRVASCAVRAFSTTTAKQAGLAKAPIQVFGREGRYAHALYSAASKSSSLEVVEADLATVVGVIKANAELDTFLMNPSVQRKEKTDVVKSILAETNVSDLCKNLFVVMAENGALTKADGVVAAFNKIMRAQRGEVEVVVTTAKALRFLLANSAAGRQIAPVGRPFRSPPAISRIALC